MRLALTESLDQLDAARWNTLGSGGNPFLSHEFLVALERHGCLGEDLGWVPQHLTAWDGDRLVGALPLYRKTNSYGEFVFDGSWAQAYQRSGLAYYPKLVAAVPYSPVTGPRLLLDPRHPRREETAQALMAEAEALARRSGCSSLHWLFPGGEDLDRLRARGLLLRCGTQFHWHNAGYRDFDDFLATLSADKRKKLRQERRRVAQAGVSLELLSGREVSAPQWRAFHELYCSTFWRRGGYPTLTAAFFQEIGRTLGDRVLLVLAHRTGQVVAAAFNLVGDDTLYGRHWGCREEIPGLHFEACYYRTVEYCIHRGLARFEAGAQGEHKLARGFLPVATWSAHWIAHPGFRRAVADFLDREGRAMDDYRQVLQGHSPYREGAGPGAAPAFPGPRGTPGCGPAASLPGAGEGPP